MVVLARGSGVSYERVTPVHVRTEHEGSGITSVPSHLSVQGYLVHEKTLTPLEPPYDPRPRPTIGS